MAIFDSYVSLPEGTGYGFFPISMAFPACFPRLKAHVFSTPSFQNPKVVEVLERREGPDTVQRTGFLLGLKQQENRETKMGILLGESEDLVGFHVLFFRLNHRKSSDLVGFNFFLVILW